MKVEIYRGPEEVKLRLRLLEGSDDCVNLVAVDAYGVPIAGGTILGVNKQGKIILYSGLSSCLGLQVGDEGCATVTYD